jgi:2-methylcitrate dehydratase PrpD
MTVARELAEFLAVTSAAAIPLPALDHAAMLIASTVASAALGNRLRSSEIVRALLRERGGTPEASPWFDRGPGLPAVAAARLNAVMSDAAASDDSDLRNIVHAGTTLVATSLAMAERTGAGGEEVLAAIVLGYEAAGRIGAAVTPGFRNRGFHGCLVAIFGGAVAAGRLIGLDAARLAQAIALSATSIGGLMAAANTSLAREYHAGLAAMLGVEAALAAARGYPAEEGILEAGKGFFEVYGANAAAAAGAEVTSGLGRSWDILTDMAIKLMPGGHPYHALAEAAANAAREADIAPHDVALITVSRPGMTALGGPLHPEDLVGMAHSPAYFVAAGAADREFSWAHATAAKIGDPVIHRLIDLVRVGPAPADAAPYRQGATVTIRTTDGRGATSTVFVPQGAAARGLAWAAVDAKYRALVPQALPASQVEASLEVIHEFRGTGAVAALTGLLRA